MQRISALGQRPGEGIWSARGVCPLSRTPYITRESTYVSARAAANPRDEIREPRRENAGGYSPGVSLPRVSVRVSKLKTVASLGTDYAIPDECETCSRNVLHARLTPLLISHFSRITQHYEIQALLMSFRPQIDFIDPVLPRLAFVVYLLYCFNALSMILFEMNQIPLVIPRQIVTFQTGITYQSSFIRSLPLAGFIICGNLRAARPSSRVPLRQKWPSSAKLKVLIFASRYSPYNYNRTLESTFLLSFYFRQILYNISPRTYIFLSAPEDSPQNNKFLSSYHPRHITYIFIIFN